MRAESAEEETTGGGAGCMCAVVKMFSTEFIADCSMVAIVLAISASSVVVAAA